MSGRSADGNLEVICVGVFLKGKFSSYKRCIKPQERAEISDKDSFITMLDYLFTKLNVNLSKRDWS